jgi:hypothetical protein
VGEGCADAPREHLDVGRALEVLAQEHELVPPEPDQRVAGAAGAAEPAGDGDEQLVADLVAVDVVDELEAVEVGEEDRRVRVGPLGALRCVLQALLERQAVGSPVSGSWSARWWKCAVVTLASSRAWALVR